MSKYKNKIVHILDLIFSIIGILGFIFIAMLLIEVLVDHSQCEEGASCGLGVGIGIALVIIFSAIGAGYQLLPLILSIVDKKVNKKVNPLLIINASIQLLYIVGFIIILIQAN